MNSKLKLPIIIAVVAIAGVAGLFMSGMIGGKSSGPAKKHVIEPVTMAAPFQLNTGDTDEQHYAVFNLALQLEPMDEVHYANWSGANAGGHGGAKEAPGPAKLSTYPKIRDAVIEVTSQFKAAELTTPRGKAAFKKELLQKFDAIAAVDEAEHKASPEDPTTIGIDPPYHVMDITLTDFAVQ